MSRGFSCAVTAFVVGLMLAACATSGTAPSTGRAATPAANSASPVSPPPVNATTTQQPSSGGASPLPANSGPPLLGTGLTGTTVVDGCPVMRDPPCPDKPVAARLSVIE